MVQRDLSTLPEGAPLRKYEVLSILPFSRATWDNGVASGRFPKPVYLSPRVPTWGLGVIMKIARGE